MNNDVHVLVEHRKVIIQGIYLELFSSLSFVSRFFIAY